MSNEYLASVVWQRATMSERERRNYEEATGRLAASWSRGRAWDTRSNPSSTRRSTGRLRSSWRCRIHRRQGRRRRVPRSRPGSLRRAQRAAITSISIR